MSFAPGSRRVSQAGNDRESVLAHTRAQRALRNRKRAEHSSALFLQKLFRSGLSLRYARDNLSSRLHHTSSPSELALALSVLGSSLDRAWTIPALSSLVSSQPPLDALVSDLPASSSAGSCRRSIRLRKLALLSLRVLSREPKLSTTQLFDTLVSEHCPLVCTWLLRNGALPAISHTMYHAPADAQSNTSAVRAAVQSLLKHVVPFSDRTSSSLAAHLLAHPMMLSSFYDELHSLRLDAVLCALSELYSQAGGVDAVEYQLISAHGQWAPARLICSALEVLNVHDCSESLPSCTGKSAVSQSDIAHATKLLCLLCTRLLWRLPHGTFETDGKLVDPEDLEQGDLTGSIAPQNASPPPHDDRALRSHLPLLQSHDVLRQLLTFGILAPTKAPFDSSDAERSSGPAAFVAACEHVLTVFLRQSQDDRGKLMFNLSFSNNLPQRMWRATRELHDSSRWPERLPNHEQPWISVMGVFAPIMSFVMLSADDVDFFEHKHPVQPEECALMVDTLRAALWQLAWVDPGNGVRLNSSMRLAAAAGIQNLLAHLNTRNSRRPFMDGFHFIANELMPCISGPRAAQFVSDACEEGKRANELLTRGPSLVPFTLRVKALQEFIRQDKLRMGRSAGLDAMGGGTRVHVRRDNLVHDAFSELYTHDPHVLKGSLKIEFVDEFGLQEAGIDGGGLLKDFIESLCREISLNPPLGIFRETADHKLYPNPAASDTNGKKLILFEFVGIVLGKALYEGILTELPLAHFFLSKLKGKSNGFNDLHSLDEELWRSLAYLKRYNGDVGELGLTFTVNSESEGREVGLVKDGKQIPVTSANNTRYVELVARYKLNDEIASQSEAFLRGFQRLMNREWLLMFNENELQALISGKRHEGFDVDDLQANSVFSGGFSADDRCVKDFFATLRSLSAEEQRKFLRFCTACPNPPLLGFKELQPPFTIHRAASGQGESADNERLPSSTTCSNILKLPPYSSQATMREKLLRAIQDASGFHLS